MFRSPVSIASRKARHLPPVRSIREFTTITAIHPHIDDICHARFEPESKTLWELMEWLKDTDYDVWLYLREICEPIINHKQCSLKLNPIIQNMKVSEYEQQMITEALDWGHTAYYLRIHQRKLYSRRFPFYADRVNTAQHDPTAMGSHRKYEMGKEWDHQRPCDFVSLRPENARTFSIPDEIQIMRSNKTLFQVGHHCRGTRLLSHADVKGVDDSRGWVGDTRGGFVCYGKWWDIASGDGMKHYRDDINALFGIRSNQSQGPLQSSFVGYNRPLKNQQHNSYTDHHGFYMAGSHGHGVYNMNGDMTTAGLHAVAEANDITLRKSWGKARIYKELMKASTPNDRMEYADRCRRWQKYS